MRSWFGRRSSRSLALLVAVILLPSLVFAQANGQLQIHQLNVGQGDAALIVSPLGETMLIDTGPTSASSCQSATGIITQLANLGLTRLDYHVASHYHADHIGCSDLVVNRWPVQIAAYDRGTNILPTTQVYTRYANAVSLKRQTVSLGQQIVLDAGSANPVIFRVVATSENVVSGSLDENDRSVVLVLTFGSFDATFGGDWETRGEAHVCVVVSRGAAEAPSTMPPPWVMQPLPSASRGAPFCDMDEAHKVASNDLAFTVAPLSPATEGHLLGFLAATSQTSSISTRQSIWRSSGC